MTKGKHTLPDGNTISLGVPFLCVVFQLMKFYCTITI